MYYPYLRGKQNEISLVTAQAPLLANAGFVPIIEPVKSNLNPLKNALDAVVQAGGRAIVIVNPQHGEHGPHGTDLSTLLTTHFSGSGITPAVLLTNQTTSASAVTCAARHPASDISFVHCGFRHAATLAGALPSSTHVGRQIFIGDNHGSAYKAHFQAGAQILVRSNFNKTDNSRYPAQEYFSDLHVRFRTLGYDGFGDFLTVADEFSSSGGPAWAVAIHLTYIDRASSSEINIHHFVSTTRNTQFNPGGKFLEAVRDLVTELNRPNNQIREFAAAAEFRDLHARAHFPGLGIVKRLSMQHHIETLADYFDPPIG